MIKFFRNIRKKLVEQNRISKYLLYAFGEIVLVVIGILIALQINNWNDKNNQEKKVANFLVNIETQISDNISVTESGVNIIEYINKKSEDLITVIGQENSEENQKRLDTLIVFHSSDVFFKPKYDYFK